MSINITCLSGRVEPQRCLVDGPVMIGRDPNCDLRCFDDAVSRFHCRLEPQSSALLVSDCGARNGVLLNGQRIEQCTATHGALIQIGALQFLVEDGERSADETRLLTDQGSSFSIEEGAASVATSQQTDILLRVAAAPATQRLSVACRALQPCFAADRVGIFSGSSLLAGDIDDQLANRLAGGSRARLLRLGEELHGQTVASASIGSALVCPIGQRGYLILVRDVDRDAYDSSSLAELADLANNLEPFLQPQTIDDHGGLVGSSVQMHGLRERLRRFAASAAAVLITGESGTGKELAARALHKWSARSQGPFVAINCAAVAEQLFEAELFGHAKGAFTGADQARPGFLRSADGGTIFLDEIGELPLALQAKLLRCLQEGEVQGVGESQPERISIRVIAATNRDLQQEVDAGRFRADLLFRLDVLRVHMPALREHPDDLPELVQYLLHRAASEAGCPLPRIGEGLLKRLAGETWSGNVRQLENALMRAAVMAQDIIGPEHIELTAGEAVPVISGGHFPTLAELEAGHIRAALAKTDGNKSEAARLLGISRPTIRRKIVEYGLPDRP